MIRTPNVPSLTNPVSRTHQTETTPSQPVLRRFATDRRGSIGMMLALMVYPIMMLIGFGVDYSRTLAVKVRMQSILDAAALAAARAAQTASSSNIATVAENAAKNYFNMQDINQVVSGSKLLTTPITINSAKTEFTLNAQAWIQTPFMNAGSILISKPQVAEPGEVIPSQCSVSWWSCQKVKSTASSLLQAGNGDESIEVSMMLDVTGSMSGTKITDLRAAAKDAVDILIWADQSKATSKIALAPFAQAVDVGSFAAAVTGRPATSTGSVKTASGGNEDDNKSAGTGNLRPCVIERLGTNAYTDEAPSATNGWIGSYGANNAPSGYSYNDSLSSSDADYNSDGTCSSSIQEKATIVPLTSDKEVLKKRITDMELGSGTAGHLGTAWAWYLLSPKWNSIWPEGSKPAAYGTAKLKKIAILMTDGDYNTDYSSGSSKSKAETLCTNMKTATIEVYTVGFMVSDDAKAMLKECATDASHFYNAADGDALRMAFRDIALKISSLRLSK